MKNSLERLNLIKKYLVEYENIIKISNAQGLFDAAKMFELFALEVCKLWFGTPFKNLNETRPNFPFADLVSEDESIYCQVSTCENVPQKIKETLTKLANSNDDNAKKISPLYFFVLNNDSVNKVKNYAGKNRIGGFDFYADEHLITTAKVFAKAEMDLDFQLGLYDLLKKDSTFYKRDLPSYKDSLLDSKRILDEIPDTIGDNYQIDLSEEIKGIDLQAKSIFITGEPGSGKTVLCKKLLENKTNVLFLRSARIASEKNIRNIWDFDFSKVFSLVKGDIYIYIDALEFVSDCPERLDNLTILFEEIGQIENAHIVASCRNSEISRFVRFTGKPKFVTYETHSISSEELKKIINAVPNLRCFVEDQRYRSLTKNPFYLHFLSTVPDLDTAKDVNEVRKRIWREVICAGNPAYANTVTKIVLDRAKKFVLGVSRENYSSDDVGCIDALLREGVLVQIGDTQKVRLKYDIFEDICFEQYIDKLFEESKGNLNVFSDQLSELGRCAFRRYQIWVENKLFASEDREGFLYDLVFEEMPSSLKEQTRIGIIKSNYCADFFEQYGNDLVERGDFVDFIRLTNLYGFSISGKGFPDNMQLMLCGAGRSCLIELVANHISACEDEGCLADAERMVIDYSKGERFEDAGESACKILIYLLKKYEVKDSDGDIFYSYQEIKKYVKALFRLNAYCKSWISDFINLIRQDFGSKKRAVHGFADEAIKDIIQENGRYIVKWASRDIFNLMDLYFCGRINDNISLYYRSFYNDDTKYGFNGNAEYFLDIGANKGL